MLSVIIPIHNQEPSVLALYDRLTSVLESLAQPYEIIFVDDASTDRSFVRMRTAPITPCTGRRIIAGQILDATRSI